MNLEFIAGFAMGALLIGAAATIALGKMRRPPPEIADWTPAAYEPQHQPPRAITRLTKNDFIWEIE